MRLRQIALVASDIRAQTRALTQTLGIEVAYRDPNVAVFGLVNIVAPVGGEFLEIVAPDQEDTAAGRYLERRGGDSGYMVILQTDDAARERERIADLGIRVIWTTDRPDHVAGQFHPSDIGGVLLSVESKPGVIEIDDHMCDWPPAGPTWRKNVATDRVTAIVGVEIAADNPAAMSTQWGEILNENVEHVHDQMYAILLNDATIRFAPISDSRGPGIRSVDLTTQKRAEVIKTAAALRLPFSNRNVTICGTGFNLR